MTAAVIDLAAQRARHHVDAPLNLCDQPAITAVCATLTGHGACGAALAYQNGRWRHVNTGRPTCPEPQAARCHHLSCEQTADPDRPCAFGLEHCCGSCCWAADDDLEGRPLWPR